MFPNTRTTQLDCTGTNKVMCPQVYHRFTNSAFDIREDEDCLHLNIYVPLVSFSKLFILIMNLFNN